MNATCDDTEGRHNPTGSVLLPSNSSKAALNMRKLPSNTGTPAAFSVLSYKFSQTASNY